MCLHIVLGHGKVSGFLTLVQTVVWRVGCGSARTSPIFGQPDIKLDPVPVPLQNGTVLNLKSNNFVYINYYSFGHFELINVMHVVKQLICRSVNFSQVFWYSFFVLNRLSSAQQLSIYRIATLKYRTKI